MNPQLCADCVNGPKTAQSFLWRPAVKKSLHRFNNGSQKCGDKRVWSFRRRSRLRREKRTYEKGVSWELDYTDLSFAIRPCNFYRPIFQ